MTSSIGQGSYGLPTKIPIPDSQFQGSTSGIGGQSTETVSKYDSTFGFTFSYVPGSKRIHHKIGGYRYNGPTGNWGHRILRKVNLRKQVQGAAGILSANPMARIKNTKFISLNYGLQRVDPFLPRGGNVPRVVDTSNVEDPRSFYSDYNWGNAQQQHEEIAGGYATMPPNKEPKLHSHVGDADDAANVPPQQQPQHPTDLPPQAANPMSGRSGLGANFDHNDLIRRLEDFRRGSIVEELYNPAGNADLARRRGITLVDDDELRSATARDGVSSSAIGSGLGLVGGIGTSIEDSLTVSSTPSISSSNFVSVPEAAKPDVDRLKVWLGRRKDAERKFIEQTPLFGIEKYLKHNYKSEFKGWSGKRLHRAMSYYKLSKEAEEE